MVTLQIGLKKFLLLKMLKNTVLQTLLTVNKLLGHFTKKNYKKQNKKRLKPKNNQDKT